MLTRYTFDLVYARNGPATLPFCQLVARHLIGELRGTQHAFVDTFGFESDPDPESDPDQLLRGPLGTALRQLQ